MNLVTNSLKKVSWLTALTLSCMVTTSPARAASLFWDMSLFDDSGAQVGEGEFSYDPETVATFSFSNIVESGEVTVNSVLESVSISIYGEELISDSYTSFQPWWNTNSDEAMQDIEGFFRFGSQVIDDWQAPDFNTAVPFTGNLSSAFRLSGSSTNDTGEGQWTLSGREIAGGPFSGPSPSPLPDSITSILQGRTFTGSWTASLRDNGAVDPNPATTPESSSILALLCLGFSSLMVLKRKQLENRI